jgi:hypothetical protein
MTLGVALGLGVEVGFGVLVGVGEGSSVFVGGGMVGVGVACAGDEQAVIAKTSASKTSKLRWGCGENIFFPPELF